MQVGSLLETQFRKNGIEDEQKQPRLLQCFTVFVNNHHIYCKADLSRKSFKSVPSPIRKWKAISTQSLPTRGD